VGAGQEPLGGAHRDYEHASTMLKQALIEEFEQVRTLSTDELINKRRERLNRYGEIAA